MISAIAALSGLGSTLTLAKVGVVRSTERTHTSIDGGRATGDVSGPKTTDPLDPTQPATETAYGTAGRETSGDGGEPVVDVVEFSTEGLAAARKAEEKSTGQARSFDELSDEEKDHVRKLKQADRQVRAHEAAHQAAGGQYAGGASFKYQTGPDGAKYAVSGEVPIDMSPVPGDPAATIRKMQQVRRAALSPSQPSAADRNVAAKAAELEQKARAELARSDTSANGQTDDANQNQAVAASPSLQPIGTNIDLYA